ncbi:Uncharacterized protein APZ42_005407 [Daphnia magna]|uniref:Reverse transcriptase zinc-binding domain-containing protein n=1 Tax=Daphnia magna TaxID=35525 RepID=A0A164GGV3_9CRUS|nr:Uncharacterized protein APZ42_005407 [Daphnia magna]
MWQTVCNSKNQTGHHGIVPSSSQTHKHSLTLNTLHRLRSDHNRLNAYISRIDMDTDPLCRHGCQDIENANHILTTCEKYTNKYLPIKKFFQDNNLNWCSSNILGLNFTLSKSLQLLIRDQLVQFIFNTKIYLIV